MHTHMCMYRSLVGYPTQSILTEDKRLIIPDFTISTSVSSIIHVTTNGSVVDVSTHS